MKIFLIQKRLKILDYVGRNMSYLRSWDSVEELPNRGEWLRKNRRPLAVIVIMFILLPSAIILYNSNSDDNTGNDDSTEYEIYYSITIWISPLDEEFTLNLDLYGTQQNAEEQVNRIQGLGVSIRPLSDEERTLYLSTIPKGFSGFWIRICFDSHDGEPFTVLNTSIGNKATTTLLGREISVLIEFF